MNIYGVVLNEGHIDVSKTERGAKIYATKHGYTQISIRYNCGYTAAIIAEKLNGKWAKYGTSNRLEYLREQLRAERISYGEIQELQTLAPYIDKNDVELREAAGIPEN